MADAGHCPAPASGGAMARQRRKGLLTALAAIVLAGLAAGFYFGFSESEDELPPAARILLEEDLAGIGVLPHRQDEATEFNESFDHLKPGARRPPLRASTERAEAPEPVPDAAGTPPTLPATPATAALSSPPEAPPGPPADEAEAVEQVPLLRTDPSQIRVELDWEGVVLVPDTAKLARAYTSAVELTRVEAHPIDGDRLRVWARIRNRTDQPLTIAIACEFRSQSRPVELPRFTETTPPPHEAVDARFVSRGDRIHAYTILARR